MTKFVVAFQSQPEVGSKMKLPILLKEHWKWHLMKMKCWKTTDYNSDLCLELWKSLGDRGNS